MPAITRKTIELRPDEEFIRLGQLLKFAGVIDRGSDARDFLSRNKVLVNGAEENRRGAKIRPGSTVKVGAFELKVCGSEN